LKETFTIATKLIIKLPSNSALLLLKFYFSKKLPQIFNVSTPNVFRVLPLWPFLVICYF